MQPREWLLVGLLGAAFAPALVACGLMLALGALLRRLEKPR
jgi:hypothetical protein